MVMMTMGSGATMLVIMSMRVIMVMIMVMAGLRLRRHLILAKLVRCDHYCRGRAAMIRISKLILKCKSSKFVFCRFWPNRVLLQAIMGSGFRAENSMARMKLTLIYA